MKKKLSAIILIVYLMLTVLGCGATTKTSSINLTDVSKAINQQIAKDYGTELDESENIPGFTTINLVTEEEGNEVSLPINKTDIKQGVAIQPLMNVKSDKIILLEAQEGKEEAVKASLEKIKEQELQSWSTYLPDQYEKVKNTIITNNGPVFLYVTYEQPETIKDIFESFFKQ